MKKINQKFKFKKLRNTLFKENYKIDSLKSHNDTIIYSIHLESKKNNSDIYALKLFNTKTENKVTLVKSKKAINSFYCLSNEIYYSNSEKKVMVYNLDQKISKDLVDNTDIRFLNQGDNKVAYTIKNDNKIYLYITSDFRASIKIQNNAQKCHLFEYEKRSDIPFKIAYLGENKIVCSSFIPDETKKNKYPFILDTYRFKLRKFKGVYFRESFL